MKLWPLIALVLVACSSESSNEPKTDCTPGETGVCNCSADQEGVQICQQNKTFGACDCGGGSGGSSGNGSGGSGGGDLCGDTCTRLEVCSDGTDGHTAGECWGCERDTAGDETCAQLPPGTYLGYSGCPTPLPKDCELAHEGLWCCN